VKRYGPLSTGGGRQVGGDVRTGPGDSNNGPGDQRQREDKHHRAEPACRQVGRQERRGGRRGTFGAGDYRAGWYLRDDDAIELDDPMGWEPLSQ
jgi:hypothetical protein